MTRESPALRSVPFALRVFALPLLVAACTDSQGLESSGSEIVGLPNLRLSSITRGELDAYDVEVCNDGTAAAEGFEVSFYSVSPEYGFYVSYGEWIPGLAPSTCQTLSVPCWSTGSGDCNDAGGMIADADPHGMIIESSEVDNTLEVRFGSLENLVSHQISRTLEGYLVEVCNDGEGNIDWLEAQIFTDSEAYGFYISYGLGLVQLAAGSCQTELVPCWAVGEGSCADQVNAIVVLDPYQMVRESNEGDNLVEQAFTTQRDLEAGSITRTLDSYLIEVCNVGAAPTEWAEVSFYSSSDSYGTYQAYAIGAPPLEPGVCHEEYVPCWAFGDGSCADQVRVVMDVDPFEMLLESDETNNISESSFQTERNLSAGAITRSAIGYSLEVCNTGLAPSEWAEVQVHQISLMYGFYPAHAFGTPPLDAGNCHQELVPCSAIGDGSCTDSVAVVVEIDPFRQILETDESDNFAHASFAGGPQATGLPDHRVASLARTAFGTYDVEVCNDGLDFHPAGVLLDFLQRADHHWQFESAGVYWVPAVDPGTCQIVPLPCGIFGNGTCEDTLTLRASLVSADWGAVLDDQLDNDALLVSFDDRPDLRLADIRRFAFTHYEFEICNDGSANLMDGFMMELFEKRPQENLLQPRGVYYAPPVEPGTCEVTQIPCGAFGNGTCEDVLTVRAVLRSVDWESPLDRNPSNDARTAVFADRPDHRLGAISREAFTGYTFEVCNDGSQSNLDGVLLELYEQRPDSYALEGRGVYYMPPVEPLSCESFPIPCGALGDGTCEDVLTIRGRLRSAMWHTPLDNNPFNDFASVAYTDRPDHRVASIRRDAGSGYEVDVCNDGPATNLTGMMVELYQRAEPDAYFEHRGALWVQSVAPQSCETLQFPCSFIGDGTCEDDLLLRASLQSSDWRQPLDNNPSNDFAYAPFGLPDSPRVAAQVGVILAKQTHKNAWGTVQLGHGFQNPVVVFNAISFADSAPAHGRARNVLADRFQWQIEEWDYLDGKHGTESMPWLVVESGRHTLADLQASALEAGKVNTTHVWTTVTFSEPFPMTPVVLTGIMSDNDPRAVVPRIRNVTTTGFQVRVQEAEADDGIHVAEVVGWVAILPGVRDVAGMAFEANNLTNTVTHQFHPVSFAAPFSSPPILLASLASYSGSDPAGIRIKGPDGGGVLSVKVEEEKSKDAETNHAAETVSWFAFGEPGLLYDR